MNRLASLFLVFLLASFSAVATIYQEPERFIAEVFPNEQPEAKTLWLKKDVRPTVERILGHGPRFLRVRYWQSADRRAFILEEIGKTEPITFGIVVRNQQIENIRVLEFRESRGWEIRQDFFSTQFLGARVTEELKLDARIDGISGATLSVRAMKKVARLALFFDKTLTDKQ